MAIWQRTQYMTVLQWGPSELRNLSSFHPGRDLSLEAIPYVTCTTQAPRKTSSRDIPLREFYILNKIESTARPHPSVGNLKVIL